MRKIYLLVSTAALTLLSSGCSHVSYLWQAGLGQLSLYNHERKIDEVLQDPRVPAEVKERLSWIAEVKKMVESELGIKATSNYTTYVDLKRPYVIWSISAAEPFELKTKEWTFPVVGAFPYLGFFNENTAKKWRDDYSNQGFDTYIRGVSAYSTIGYLRDPMLSSMLSRNKADMVNLIFHESMHGYVYLKSQGSFNEQIASYVGDYGERQWIARTYGESSEQMRLWNGERADRRRFGQMMRTFADELKVFYAASTAVPAAERLTEKQKRFDAFAQKLKLEPWKGRGYVRAAQMVTNNAALLAFLTYEDEQDLFDLLEKKTGGVLKNALQLLKDFSDEWKAASNHPTSPQLLLRKKLN